MIILLFPTYLHAYQPNYISSKANKLSSNNALQTSCNLVMFAVDGNRRRTFVSDLVHVSRNGPEA